MRFEPFVRRRLIERIQKASQYRVTLIAASAGFGKSTLLRQFLAEYPRAHIRFDVRAEHATLLSFVRGFADALEPLVPHLRSSFATAYESARQAAVPADALAEWVHGNIKDLDLTVVIDDFQHVQAQAEVLRFVNALVESSAGFQRWIFSTRTATVFPVAVWWERGSMALPLEELELQFTEQEAIDIARQRGINSDDGAVLSLWRLTAGWPMAFLLGLSIEGGLEGTSALAMQGRTREIVYASLAKRAFSQASEKAQRFMLETCKFPTIDRADLQKAHLSVDDSILAEIEGFGTFFESVSEHRYRYPDLFRDFLEQSLAEIGENAVQRAHLRAARALEENGQYSAALKRYIEARSTDDMLRILEAHGFQLIESGNGDAITSAVGALTEAGQSENTIVLGLQAVLESSRGRNDTSDAWFRAAIDGAQSDSLRVELSNRFAEAMLHRYRGDCVAILEPLIEAPKLSLEQRARVYSTLSTAYVMGQRFGDALLLMHRAFDLLSESKNPRLNASVYQQAAWISLFTGDIPNAKTYGARAIKWAMECGLYEVAARAHSVLVNVTGDIEDEPEATMEHLRAIADLGLKSGSSHLRLYALLGQYDQLAERGETAALEDVERSIDAFEFTHSDMMSMEALLPAKALHCAAGGDFDRAYRHVADSADRQGTDDRKAFRWSEIALYAAASGRDAEADHAVASAGDFLEDLDPRLPRTIRTRINLLLASLLLGRDLDVRRLLSALRTGQPPGLRLTALIAAVAAVAENWRGAMNYEEILSAFNELKAQHMGGVVGLLEALPRRAAIS